MYQLTNSPKDVVVSNNSMKCFLWWFVQVYCNRYCKKKIRLLTNVGYDIFSCNDSYFISQYEPPKDSNLLVLLLAYMNL